MEKSTTLLKNKIFNDKISLLAKSGDSIIIDMLKKKEIVINQTFGDADGGPTVLHFAAISSAGLPLLRQLIKYEGINVNYKDKNGLTPLHYAVINKNIVAVEELIRAGADYKMPVGHSKNEGVTFMLGREDDQSFVDKVTDILNRPPSTTEVKEKPKDNLKTALHIQRELEKDQVIYQRKNVSRKTHGIFSSSCSSESEQEPLIPSSKNSYFKMK